MPSSFKSSRKTRSDTSQIKSRPEDYMDAEDLAEYRQLQTTSEYADQGPETNDPFLRLLSNSSSHLQAGSSQKGQAIMQLMGWKPGQGIGPLVSGDRRAQLIDLLERMHLASPSLLQTKHAAPHDEARRYKFPPPDTHMYEPPKDRRQSLGVESSSSRSDALQLALQQYHRAQGQQRRPQIGAAGMDSDDEDHVYAPGPSMHDSTLAYTEQDSVTLVEDTEPPTPVTPAKTHTPAVSGSVTWHDGRPLPPGFVLAKEPLPTERIWNPPPVPSNWVPDPHRVWLSKRSDPSNASNTSRPSNANDRRAILGEAPPPGPPPMITEYIKVKAPSSDTSHLESPAARVTSPKQLKIHPLDPVTARRALAAFRGTGKDPRKDQRYRAYVASFLEGPVYLPPKGVALDAQQDEVDEFYQTACRHRPVHGDMAHRFTSSTFLQDESIGVQGGLQHASELQNHAQKHASQALESVPQTMESEPPSAAVRAARNGEFGALTRHIGVFYPPHLLCKRHGVPDPHPERDADSDDLDPTDLPDSNDRLSNVPGATGTSSSWSSTTTSTTLTPMSSEVDDTPGIAFAPMSQELETAMEREMQASRPPMDLFKAIFQSDDDDDDNVEDDRSDRNKNSDSAGMRSRQSETTTHVTFTHKRAASGPKKKKRERTGPLTFSMEDDVDANDTSVTNKVPRRCHRSSHASNM